jgi:hypothetical protein
MTDKTDEADARLQDVQRRLNEEIANARKQRQAKQELQAQLEEVSARLASAEAERKAEADRRHQERLESEGRYKEALRHAQAQHQQALTERNERIAGLTEALEHEAGSNRLREELGRAGVRPELIGQAATLLAPQVKVALAAGRPEVRVFAEDGRPLTRDDGSPAALADLVAAWVPNNAHFVPPSGDTGSGSHKGGAAAASTLAELDADPARKHRFIETHGVGAYLRKAAAEREAGRQG